MASTTSSIPPFATRATSWWRVLSGELGPSRYFSVFRDARSAPVEGAGLEPGERARLLAQVADSPVFAWGVEEGRWTAG